MERTLETHVDTGIELDELVAVLVKDPRAILNESYVSSGAERRYPVFLSADLGRAAGVRHEAVVELGAPSRTADETRWPLRWAPTSHLQALPTFSGVLVVTRTPAGTRLTIEGSYRPPLGPVGALGDGVIGHRIARSCADHLLAAMADRLERHVDHDRRVAGTRPAPYPPDLRP